jgi:branched-chain amino acid transport system substrate-binding protein
MPRLLRPLAGLVAIALVVGACSGGDGDDGDGTSGPTTTTAARARGDGTLVLGQLAPQTGPLTSISESLIAPVQIALGEVNAAGGFNSHAVGHVLADDGSGTDPETATASFDKLVGEDRADAVIGPSASGTALDLLDDIRGSGPLMCSGSNSAPELTGADSGGSYFRTAPPDRLQAIALARLTAGDGRRRPAVVVRDDAYGEAFARGLVPELRRVDARLAGPVIRYDPASPELDDVARRVARMKPDSVIAVALVADGARLVRALGAAGVGPGQVPLYAPDGLQDPALRDQVDPANPAALQGIRGTAPAANPVPGDTPFATAMRRAGAEPIFSAYYYDCAILTALAAVQAKSDDPAKMRRAFARSVRGRNDCTTYVACLQLLTAGETIHYRGASSRFDRWRGNEPGEGVYDRWAYGTDGRAVTAADGRLAVP